MTDIEKSIREIADELRYRGQDETPCDDYHDGYKFYCRGLASRLSNLLQQRNGDNEQMKITYDDYLEFINSLSSRQSADLVIALSARITPTDQRRIDDAHTERMAYDEEVKTTKVRTFRDGMKVTMVERDTVIVGKGRRIATAMASVDPDSPVTSASSLDAEQAGDSAGA